MEVMIGPDNVTMKKIKAELGVEDARFLKQIEMFEEWIKCENHLPKNVDRHLVENFIRLCKCDMVKAKKKFEGFLLAEAQLKFPYYTYDKDFFEEYAAHRDISFVPHLTPKGYRILFARFDAEPTIFNFTRFIVYGVTMARYLLYKDTHAGYAIIYDLEKLTVSHMGKINFRIFANVAALVIHKYPFRIREVHFLNTSPVTQVMVNFVKKLLGEKISKRVIIHQQPIIIEDFISTLLTEEQKVDTASLSKICENLKNELKNSQDWQEKVQHIKLLNDVPLENSNLYSLEEFGINGTFRQLSID